ncbi:MAG TPA: enolase C-terminal domain-like protein [bacterium]|nr:enolase C-terminal domain-like protein [bacterium]
MRITAVKVTVVAVPDLPLRNVIGCHQPYALRNVIQVRSDDGLTGLGEMPGGTQAQVELEEAAAHLIGMDPFRREHLRTLFPGRPRVQSAFELPCLDLAARAVGRPVADLLGGAVRDRVPMSAYLFFKFATPDDWLDTPAGRPTPRAPLGMHGWGDAVATPEAMVAEAEEFVRRYGFRVLKLKGGVLSPEEEVEALRLLRARFGAACRLRIDPNGGWSVPEALRVLPALQQIGLEYYEDPVTGMDAMAEVAGHTNVPLATNMCVTGFADLPAAASRRPVQVILADHHWWGGLDALRLLGRVCEIFGFGLSQHSNTHLGISLAAMVHAAATIPHLNYASDTHYPWQQGWDIVNEPFEFHVDDGSVSMPSGPGLGVTVNEDALQRLAEIARVIPADRRDDETVMRRWFPEWRPRGDTGVMRGLIT